MGVMPLVLKCRDCRLTVVNRKTEHCPRCRKPIDPAAAFNERSSRDRLDPDELRVVLGTSEDFSNPKRSDIVAVTSLSTRRHSIDRQRACLESWQRFGLSVFVRNTAEEISLLRRSFDGVTWIVDDETCSGYAYETQKIRKLVRTAVELDCAVLILNSDCELRGSSDWLACDDQNQFVGVRWDFDRESPQEVTEFRWGLDAFSFTPGQASLLPADFPFAIGHPVWDYAVPAVMLQNGIRLNIAHRPLIFHQSHSVNWNQQDWHRGQRWLRDRLGVSIEWGNGHFRDKLEPSWKYSKTRWVPR